MVDQEPTTDDIAQVLKELGQLALFNGALTSERDLETYENAKAYAEYLKSLEQQDVSRLSLHYSNGATQPVVIESTDELDRFDEPDIEEGSIVRDTEPADWMVKAGKNSFVVREVTDMSADEYYFDEDITVAEANPNHPPKAPVAIIERDNTELAYPVTRLSLCSENKDE